MRWCDSSPCKNGGSCWQQGASYTCQCQSGWTGLYCDIPSVSCEVAAKQQGVEVPHLCRNSGQCLDAGNTHYCRCQAGYTGSYCQEQVDECSPNPCQNGATCTDYLGGYSCEVGNCKFKKWNSPIFYKWLVPKTEANCCFILSVSVPLATMVWTAPKRSMNVSLSPARMGAHALTSSTHTSALVLEEHKVHNYKPHLSAKINKKRPKL